MSDSSILSCWCILSIFFSSLFSPLPLSMLITIPVFPPFSPSHPLSQKLLLALIWSRCYIWGIWLHLREGNCRGERKRFSLWFITFWLGCSLLWYYCKPCQVSLVLKSIWNCVFWCKTSREPEFIFFYYNNIYSHCDTHTHSTRKCWCVSPSVWLMFSHLSWWLLACGLL